ncbi:3,9-dihydroxypterocarpan 6A-monooxygenase-like [Senna tora]|uniref:3,9-dihydroxypterocarpan 6A-monooxygenase-like n=1 Tax=Senna tora TaxID=362788 RepID=A0A835CH55_9FABA|nr:3,9-dihydroxypterocarpan 6A-monooxygenase-like [Senna tora]
MSAEFLSYIQLILISLLFPILIRPILIRSRRSKSDGPPSPPSLPLIEHIHLLPPIPPPFIPQPLLSLRTHPPTPPQLYPLFPNANIHHLSYDPQGFLFRAYGLHRKFMKKLCMTRLLGGPTLHLLHPVRRTETMRFLYFLLKKVEAHEVVDVGDELLTLTNRIVSRIILILN